MKKSLYVSAISIIALFVLFTGCPSPPTSGNNPRFVAVGNNGQAWWSTDGSAGSWTASSPGGNPLWGIAYGNGRFVAVGSSGQAWWSADGSAGSWTASSPGGNNLNDIAYGNGRFVAVGNAGQAWWSADGSAGSWTDSSPPGLNSLQGIGFRP